jgi:hypothetical protein
MPEQTFFGLIPRKNADFPRLPAMRDALVGYDQPTRFSLTFSRNVSFLKESRRNLHTAVWFYR